ncbi:MAG: matrixin family metalloprotease [Planctomycetota bacterium]
MRTLLRIALGTAVLTLAAGSSLFLAPDTAAGFTTIGGSLNLTQRDHRLFNNFTNPEANNNTVEHVNWPGDTGAELAIRKAAAEWNGDPYGTGKGDPSQTNVGSGGADFSFFWNGNATGVGSTNSNIHSMIPGSNGGVLAFTETPISDGWRIRYYQKWTWQDGPGTSFFTGIDLQGVATHELGHALGLGHSSVGGATMAPSISGTGVAQRSIAQDDKNGVQSIYGARSANNPDIASLSGSMAPGGTAVITGSSFSATGNEVWLNNDPTTSGKAGGEPIKITGLASTAGGTQISFTWPTTGIEATGDITVKRNANGNAALAPPDPYDIRTGGPVTDTILLSGPSPINVGDTPAYSFSAAPGSSPYFLLASKELTGSVINGQPFDIGPIWKTLKTGTTTSSGTGSWTSPPIRARFSGKTAFLEVRVDSGGQTFDSNALTVTVN